MGKTYRIYRDGTPPKRVHPDNPVTPEHPEQADPIPATTPTPVPATIPAPAE